jgi:hypothetical protein
VTKQSLWSLHSIAYGVGHCGHFCRFSWHQAHAKCDSQLCQESEIHTQLLAPRLLHPLVMTAPTVAMIRHNVIGWLSLYTQPHPSDSAEFNYCTIASHSNTCSALVLLTCLSSLLLLRILCVRQTKSGIVLIVQLGRYSW